MESPAKGDWKEGLLGRLRYYLIGLAIGFVMLGFFQAAKKREAMEREARRQQVAQPVPPAPVEEPAKPDQ
jgi:hypothetical protein